MQLVWEFCGFTYPGVHRRVEKEIKAQMVTITVPYGQWPFNKNGS